MRKYGLYLGMLVGVTLMVIWSLILPVVGILYLAGALN